MNRDDLVDVALDLTERDLILEHTFVDSDLERRLEPAEVGSGGRVIVRLTPDDLGRLLEFIAAEANHTTDEKLERRLEAIYDRPADEESGLDLEDD